MVAPHQLCEVVVYIATSVTIFYGSLVPMLPVANISGQSSNTDMLPLIIFLIIWIWIWNAAALLLHLLVLKIEGKVEWKDLKFVRSAIMPRVRAGKVLVISMCVFMTTLLCVGLIRLLNGFFEFLAAVLKENIAGEAEPERHQRMEEESDDLTCQTDQKGGERTGRTPVSHATSLSRPDGLNSSLWVLTFAWTNLICGLLYYQTKFDSKNTKPAWSNMLGCRDGRERC